MAVLEEFLLTLLEDRFGVVAWVDAAVLVRMLLETVDASAADWSAHVVIMILGGVRIYNRVAAWRVV